jgi:type I restriction enzyme S subunit
MIQTTEAKKTKDKLVPALRFKEFKGKWNRKKLRELLTIGSGKDYKHLKTGNIPVYGTGGLMAKVDTPIHTGKTVFIGRKGSIDKPFYYEGDFWTVDTLFYTHSFQETEPYFVYGLFQKINWYKHNEASGVPSLSKTTIGSLLVNLPSLPEQQKIASFLSAVDEKIQQLTKKKALLEQYKKGVMQQLFSGQLRFKDENGNPYPDWEEKRITELAKTSIGLVTSMTKHYVDSGVALIRNSDIKQNKVRKDKLINLAYNFAEENKNRQLLESDIVTVHTGDIGVSAVIDKELHGCQGFATLNTRINNQNVIISEYLCWYYNSRGNIKYAIRMSTGDGRSNYNLKDFNRAIIPVPSIEEQQKIASFLSSIDTKIEAVNNQLIQTQTFKKGLLQQMFV